MALLDEEYLQFTNKFKRQKQMLQGETTIFLISIIAGIFFIYRAGVSRIKLAKRQRNFILAVSHELKSPLTTIQMVLETFDKKQLSASQLATLTQSGLTETDRLKVLIDNLLLIARQEYTRDTTVYQTPTIGVLKKVIKKFEMLYPEFKVRLIPDQTEFNTSLSENELVHIYNNLLSNVIKYAGADATLVITITSDANEYEISFADQGISIPDSEKSQIFNMFYRVGNEETRTSKGTGIGLYLVSQLMKRANGTVTVKDNVPSGSIFTLHFKK